uniref:Ribosomal protein L6 n=1 Tax=Capsaspora owczarzaki TaxID=192875 RepID=M1KF86_9EUKA|nr:ribosomal protein L6 [Capsaspora owczarzaki]
MLSEGATSTYVLVSTLEESSIVDKLVTKLNNLDKTFSVKIKVTGTALKIEKINKEEIKEEQIKIGSHRYELKPLGIDEKELTNKWKISKISKHAQIPTFLNKAKSNLWWQLLQIEQGIKDPVLQIAAKKEIKGTFAKVVTDQIQTNLQKNMIKENFVTFKSGLNEISLCLISDQVQVTSQSGYHELISKNKDLVKKIGNDFVKLKPREPYKGKGIGFLKAPFKLKQRKKK